MPDRWWRPPSLLRASWRARSQQGWASARNRPPWRWRVRRSAALATWDGPPVRVGRWSRAGKHGDRASTGLAAPTDARRAGATWSPDRVLAATCLRWRRGRGAQQHDRLPGRALIQAWVGLGDSLGAPALLESSALPAAARGRGSCLRGHEYQAPPRA